MDLTLAINRYDRHVPIFNGTVRSPPGIALKPLEGGESENLEQFIGYSCDQRLVTAPFPPERLFDPASLAT